MRRSYQQALSLLTALLLVLGGVLPASALGSVETRAVRVGYYHIEGYNVMNEDGSRSGYGYEVLQAMKLYTNWTYRYIGYDKGWADIQQMLRDGEIDMVISAVKTPARIKVYDFSKRPVSQSGACLMVKAGESPYVAGQYDSYNGMRVGFIENASQIASTAAFAKEKGFTYKPVYYKTSGELENAILSGTEVDAIVTSNMRIIAGTRRLELFAMQDVHAMVRRGNAALLAEIDYALEQISLYNPSLYDSLHNKYYSVDSGDSVFFSPEERDFIAACRADGSVLRAALTPEMPPYAYYEGDAPAGILYDIAAEILRRTGLEYRLIATKSDAEYRALIDNRGVDLRLAARFDYNYAEKLGYTLIAPYYTTDVSRVTRKGHEGPVKSVAVARGSLIETHYLPAAAKEETIVRYDSVSKCVEAVLNGVNDALYLYTETAREAVLSDETNRLTSVVMPRFTAGFSIGVREDADARLASIIEKAAASMNEDAIAEIVLKYTNYTTPPMSLVWMLYNNPILIIAMVALLLVLIFALIMVVFITRKRRREREKNLQLQEALASAEQANLAKSTFMSRMSHEIRTPLNAIIGYNAISSAKLAEVKSGAKCEETTQKALDCLSKSDIASQHLLTIINDVLDMSAIESGKIKIAHEPFNFKEMVSALTDMFLPQAKARGIDFKTVFDMPAEEWFAGDQMRIKQIFTNLLSNAVKFTPPGGRIRLAVSRRETDEHTARLHFELTDTGIGMSRDFLNNIWLPFEQADASISRLFGGTGLGLSITKNLVDLMGGTISVESEVDAGSAFKVDLTLERAEPPASDCSGNLSGAGKEPDAPDFAGARVLLAEDNQMNMEITKTILTSWNLAVDEAWNGREAVETFCAAPAGTYRAILMDVHMPEMDGYRATQAIRASSHAEAATIPIIAMTADVFAEDVAEAMAAGMNTHIGKPLEITLLLDTLRRYCLPAENQL